MRPARTQSGARPVPRWNFPPGPGDYPPVMCDEVRLALSARLDGEEPGLDPGAVRDHLTGCAGCRAWQEGAARLADAPALAALRQAPPPDLSGQIMAALAEQAPAAQEHAHRDEAHARRQVLRLAVALAATVQLALAIPALVSAFVSGGAGAGLHASREMASFDVAVAVGFLLAAARPARARVFLPVAAVLALCLAATSGLDLARGVTTFGHEVGHLVALAQAGLLWALTRSDAADSGAPPGGRVPLGERGGPVTA
jgi:predicted anti-sigma-YlaC factor YlaD